MVTTLFEFLAVFVIGGVAGAMTFTSATRDEQSEKDLLWLEQVKGLAQDDNGIAGVKLHFGHDGDRTCSLILMGDERLPSDWPSYSCGDMGRSVEKAIGLWLGRVRRMD